MHSRISTFLLLLALTITASSFVRSQALPYQTTEPGMTPKKREIYFYGMRSYPFGRIPQSARQEAILQTKAKIPAFRPSRSTLAAAQWAPIGPYSAGGRVRSVVCHPTDGKTLWCGAADGGVWKSTDRGESWKAVMDNENAIAMGAIAVDPNNPDVLYAGTGEMSSNIDSYNGAGVFKSMNGGDSWRPVGLTHVGAFSRIMVHPKNSNLVYAGATKNNSGLYRSTDGGTTWSRLLTESISDVTVNPNNEGQVWVGTMSKGVYRSDNRGDSWSLNNSGLIGPGNLHGRVSVQCAPSNPSILYALQHEASADDDDVHFARIYRSTNSGDTWTASYTGGNFLDNPNAPQGWYNNVIAVDPTDPNKVAAGGVGAVRTRNGGSDWQFIGGLHADQHAIAFDPVNPERIYIGNDGGIYRSLDGGTVFIPRNGGLAITQFYAMAIDQADPVVTYGGTQDNGTVSNLSTSTAEFLDADGFFVCVDYSNPIMIFAEQQNGFIYKVNTTNGDRTSIMNGILSDDESAWSAPLIIDPRNPSVLWHGRHRLYVTNDKGLKWVPTDVAFNGQASAMAISPVNSNIVFAGSDRGEILITSDGGGLWDERTNAPGAPNRAVTDFAPSAVNADLCYMSVSGFFTSHVFRTTDRGATWTDVSGELPDIPVNALALHPDDENILYAGTDIGMFITTDGGASWANYNQGLPRVVVADLEVHKTQRKLRMASHGRSMWEIVLEKPDLPPSILSPNGGEVWMGGTPHTISWSGIEGPVKIEYSLDDGASWGPLVQDVTAFRWTVFDTAAVAARVRVTSTTDQSRTATSRSFTITRFAPGGITQARQYPAVVYGMAFDGTSLWCTDFSSNRLLKLDANTLALQRTVTMDATAGDSMFTDLAFDPATGHLFIHRLNLGGDISPGGIVLEMDTNGHEIGRWNSPCQYPTGLVFVETPQGRRLMATDRSGLQTIYFLDPANPATVRSTAQRNRRVQYGPRSATNGPGTETVYQVITDFGGDELQSAIAEQMEVSDQRLVCSIELVSQALGGFMNARGIEFDPRDSSLWLSDYTGSIFKVLSCESKPPGPVSSVPDRGAIAGARLQQNMPNPFSGSTRIEFTLQHAGSVRLALYTMAGSFVTDIVTGRYEQGSHDIVFTPTGLASGVYRCVLTLDGTAADARTMVYVR